MEDDPSRLVQKAKLKSQNAERTLQLVVEQQVGHSKWLNASLLAINSAALFAITGQLEHLDSTALVAGPFVAGVITALLSGYCLQEFYQLSTTPVFRSWEYWSKVSITGKRNIRFEMYLRKLFKKIFRWAWVPPALGWISGLCFLSGIFAFYSNYSS